MTFNLPRKQNNSHSGFTLLEVLISIVILAFISISTYQATSKSFELRDSLRNESDFFNEIRLSLGILERDISVIYNPQLMLPEIKQQTVGPNTPNSQGQVFNEEEFGRQTTFWGPPNKFGVRAMRFVGKEDQMSFVALSHIRIYKESPESEFASITYEIKDDPRSTVDDLDYKQIKERGGSKVLVKTSSPNAFEEDDSKDPFRKTYPLVRGIKSIVFSYYRKEKDRWESKWDSDSADLKETYPDAIKVVIEVIGPKNLSFEGTYQFKPEVPLRGIDPSY